MKLRTVRDLDVKGKLVFVRVDYNVPIENGEVSDTLRITASFETIKYLLDQGCRLVLASHLGRPDGKADPKLSLAPVAAKASALLGQEIKFVSDCIGVEAEKAAKALAPGQIILLENLRFHAGEEANDPEFAAKLAALAEAYVDDAFACVHRAHASIVGITTHMPSAAGFLVENEVQQLSQAIENPKRPLLAVIGGAKLETKVELLDNLLSKVDEVLIGGEMANTMLAALGTPIGHSKYEPEEKGLARKVLDDAEQQDKEIMLPTDVIVADEISAKATARTIDAAQVAATDYIVDIGPRTVDTALAKLDDGGTVIWNGPLGITEIEQFSAGSLRLAKGIIASGATSIIGGGDTVDFIDAAGLHDKFSFVSTGGGASLELMSGKQLPGLKVLTD
jgi:phosphoglycerate kinase